MDKDVRPSISTISFCPGTSTSETYRAASDGDLKTVKIMAYEVRSSGSLMLFRWNFVVL